MSDYFHPELRKNALQLLAIDDQKIIRTAGIVQKVKNFFSKLLDPEYRKKVLELESETLAVQEILERLNQSLENLREAISAANLSEYKTQTKIVQDLSVQLLAELKKVHQKNQSIKKDLRYYAREDMEKDEFLTEFQSTLPKGYDLEFGKIYRQPVLSFEWYKNLSPSDIRINSGDGKSALTALREKIRDVLPREKYSEDEINEILKKENIPELVNNFKTAIVNGELIQVRPKVPSKNVTRVQYGQTVASIATAPFLVPGTNIRLSAEVGLIDLRTSLASSNIMSLKYTTNVRIHGNPKLEASISAQLRELKKQALSNQQRPYTPTVVNEVELAKILQSAYQKVFGSLPSFEVLGFGWAQVILESGRPIKLPANNVGNLKADDKWVAAGRPYSIMSTQELDKDGQTYVHEGAKWKAFDSPVEGAMEYWSFLQRKFPQALRWAASDSQSAAVSLGVGGYYTANIKQYSGAVQKLYQEFITKIAPQLSGSVSNPLPLPGPKPAVKNLKKEYSEMERDLIKNPKEVPQSAPKEEANPLQEIDSLMTSLYASSGPVTDLVKKALLKEKLPTTKILCRFSSEKNVDLEEKIKFASQTEHLLQKFLDAETKLNPENCLLHAEVIGSNLKVLQAAQALSDSLSDSMEIFNPRKPKIYSVITLGG